MNSTLQEQFKAIILRHNAKDNKFLLAISGGIDSMVFLDLFRQTTFNFQVAHCNFQLRGNDSDLDEALVRDYCAKNQIPFHHIRFDVEAYKQTGNFSTEMACRNLRYEWFKELMKMNQLDFLVTAHHLDDNIETFIINLSRGTGLRGLSGIPELSDQHILRPLIHFSKDEIIAYAKENEIVWREDCSNATDDYTRNKIRHHITPILKEVHPNFNQNFESTLSILKDAQSFITNQIEKIRAQFIPDENYSEINIEELNQLNNLDFIQFYLFEKYGFKDVNLINKLKLGENSAELKSTTHRLIKNRENLILTTIDNTSTNEIIIEQGEVEIKSLNLKLFCSDAKSDAAIECLDADKISFPIRLRKIKEGDFFYPIGMKGQKKLISKYFKDIKLSKIDKEKEWLLVDSQDRIIWVVNYRIDDRFKLSEHSMNFLNIIVC